MSAFGQGAADEITGELTLPETATKEREYVCTECGENVCFAKGVKRSPYFRHKSNSKCSFHETEGETHKQAKRMLCDYLATDNVKRITVSRRCSSCRKFFSIDLEYGPSVLVTAEFKFTYEGKTRFADVACLTREGEISAIFEIYCTHVTDFSVRPEPWFEFRADEVISQLQKNGPKGNLELNCIRTEFNLDKWDKCLECETYTGTIYFNQRGAGCGKTYESIQLLQDPRFLDKDTFIYLTKMKSAKDVIKGEMLDQFAAGKFPGCTLTVTSPPGANQCVAIISGRREVDVYIGTIDSFVYAVGPTDRTGSDMFQKIVGDLMKGSMKLNADGSIFYAKARPRLSSKCLIVIDEAQDLEREYIDAFQEITKKTNIDTWVIGDRLQSIMNDPNLFTYLNSSEAPFPNIVKNDTKNVVLRFHNRQLKAFINDIVRFEEFGLPEIEGICSNPTCPYQHEDDVCPYHVDYEMPDIYSGSKQEEIETYLKKIRDDMLEKVAKHGYLPNNFCFIFPVVKHTNQFIPFLNEMLVDFWADVFSNEATYTPQFVRNMEQNPKRWGKKLQDLWKDEKYYTHVVHHSAEISGTVDLRESVHATRIMSIHASKGQGCECVYFLGINDQTLSCFIDEKLDQSLVVESLLHVGLTRCKKYIWVGLSGAEGWVAERFKDYAEGYSPKIDIRFPFIKAKNVRCPGEVMNAYVDVDHFTEAYCQQSGPRVTLDWGHHVKRNAVMRTLIDLTIFHDCRKDNSHMYAIFQTLKRAVLEKTDIKKYRKAKWDLGKIIGANIRDENHVVWNLPIPIMVAGFKTKGYAQLADKVWALAKNVQDKLSLPKPSFCPNEALMFHHMVEMVQHPFDLTLHICDLYKVLAYNGRVNSEHTKVFECGCIPSTESQDDDENMSQNIQIHYETVSKVDLLMKVFLSDDVTGCPNSKLQIKKNKRFKLCDNKKRPSVSLMWEYDYVAFSENGKEAVCVYVSPQMTTLNYDDLLKRILIDRCLMNLYCEGEVRIFVYILTLDHRFPILVEFKESLSNEMVAFLRKFIHKMYEDYNERVFKYVDSFADRRWCEVNKQLKSIPHPYYIDVYFDNKTEDDEDYVPNRDVDKAHLDKRIRKKINDLFPAVVSL